MDEIDEALEWHTRQLMTAIEVKSYRAAWRYAYLITATLFYLCKAQQRVEQ